jgi:hypothetical protein
MGQKVTRVALKRMLKDATVSVVLLNADSYDQMQASLSDDRLVCVINDDSILNIFETRYGVEREAKEITEKEESKDLVVEDESLSDDNDVVGNDLSWDDIIKHFDEIGRDDDETDDGFVEDEEFDSDDDLETKEWGSVDESVDDEDSNEEPSIQRVVGEQTFVTPVSDNKESSSHERALMAVIDNLNKEIEELKEELDNSVSAMVYRDLKKKFEESESNYKDLKEQYDQLVVQFDKGVFDNQTLRSENETLRHQMDDIKGKFADLLSLVEKQKEKLKERETKSSPTIKPLKRNYPNVQFIVPLSSNSVIKMYEYIASRTDNFLFLDLTNNSYIDNYIKFESLYKPSKWLLGDWGYKNVIANNKTHKNIKVISSVVHEWNSDDLLKLAWDKLLGDLALERVVINIGSIYDNHVLDVLKAVENHANIMCFLGDLKRDQRIGKFALRDLKNYKVLASQTVVDAFGMVTDRY